MASPTKVTETRRKNKRIKKVNKRQKALARERVKNPSLDLQSLLK
jgi:hypothetical protein